MRTFRLSCALLVLLIFSFSRPAEAKKGGKSAVDLQGWCCVECEVRSGGRNACIEDGGVFSETEAGAREECDEAVGWCCSRVARFRGTRKECARRKAVFFCTEKESVKKCPPLAAKKKKEGAGKQVKAAAPATEALAPGGAAAPAAAGWCYEGGKLLSLGKAQCAKRKGRYFGEKKTALAFSRSLQGKSAPGKSVKGLAAKGPATMSQGMQPMSPAPAAKTRVFGRKVSGKVLATKKKPLAAAPAKEGLHRVAAGPGLGRASSLQDVIEIFEPEAGEVFDWGDTITVRYRVAAATEAGDVTFRFLSPTGMALATTTHRYEPPPDLEGPLEGIEAATDIGLMQLEDDSGEDDDPEPWGIGDMIFPWTLPEDGGRNHGYGFSIGAKKGLYAGGSGRFTMIPDCGGAGAMTGGLEPPQAVVRRGQAVTVAFAFCGWNGLSETATSEVYIHPRSQGVDAMALWTIPAYSVTRISEDRVRGALRVIVPRDYPLGEDHVFTLPYGVGEFTSTRSFAVADPMERGDIELTDLVRDAVVGDVIARIWVGSAIGEVTLPIEANGRILMPIVRPGENDVVVGSMPWREDPGSSLPIDAECAVEWSVFLDPNGDIDESDEGNNRESRVFSYYRSAGGLWLDRGVGQVRYMDCDCFDGPGACSVSVLLKNCSNEPVPHIERRISVSQNGTRPRTDGGLGVEEFEELDLPLGISIGEIADLVQTTLPVGEYARVTVSQRDFGFIGDSTLTFSFDPPVSDWSGVPGSFEVIVEYGHENDWGECVYE